MNIKMLLIKLQNYKINIFLLFFLLQIIKISINQSINQLNNLTSKAKLNSSCWI